MITEEELLRIVDNSQRIPPASRSYLVDDFVSNLLITVIDFNMTATVAARAMEFYQVHHGNEVRTLDDLKAVLSRFPNTKEGNTQAAQYLLGYRLWTRVELLRQLVGHFESVGIIDKNALKRWPMTSTFKQDFAGKIRISVKGRTQGLGYAVYKWLVMRQGVETVKPDVHLHRFVERIVGRVITDYELVSALERVANELGLKAYELDWRIWEYERGGGIEVWPT